MTVQELIDELAMHPKHQPVKVLLSSVMILPKNGEPYEEHLTSDDSIEADRVRNQGNHVLIISK